MLHNPEQLNFSSRNPKTFAMDEYSLPTIVLKLVQS